jgi:TPR repeat protein
VVEASKPVDAPAKVEPASAPVAKTEPSPAPAVEAKPAPVVEAPKPAEAPAKVEPVTVAKTEPAAPPATVSPAATAPSASSQADWTRLINRGQQHLAQGNVAVARQYFLRAASAGSAAGALRLAETYDPRQLAQLRVVGLAADLAEARKWYERARDLGAPEAADRLSRLPSG